MTATTSSGLAARQRPDFHRYSTDSPAMTANTESHQALPDAVNGCGPAKDSTGRKPCSHLVRYSMYLIVMKIAAPSTVSPQKSSSFCFWLVCAQRTPIAIVHELISSTQV